MPQRRFGIISRYQYLLRTKRLNSCGYLKYFVAARPRQYSDTLQGNYVQNRLVSQTACARKRIRVHINIQLCTNVNLQMWTWRSSCSGADVILRCCTTPYLMDPFSLVLLDLFEKTVRSQVPWIPIRLPCKRAPNQSVYSLCSPTTKDSKDYPPSSGLNRKPQMIQVLPLA